MIAYKIQLQYVIRDKIQSETKSENFFFQQNFFLKEFFSQQKYLSGKKLLSGKTISLIKYCCWKVKFSLKKRNVFEKKDFVGKKNCREKNFR